MISYRINNKRKYDIRGRQKIEDIKLYIDIYRAMSSLTSDCMTSS